MHISFKSRLLSIFLLLTVFTLSSCGNHPEATIIGEWVEIKAQYEEYSDIDENDDEYDHRKVIRHETEQWIFAQDKTFTIKKPHQPSTTGKWRMSGRGHILQLFYDDEDTNDEVYDIKELNDREMIINVDIDMEIRGIGAITFKRKVPPDADS